MSVKAQFEDDYEDLSHFDGDLAVAKERFERFTSLALQHLDAARLNLAAFNLAAFMVAKSPSLRPLFFALQAEVDAERLRARRRAAAAKVVEISRLWVR